MKDLTTETKDILLRRIKSFLSITWNDDDTQIVDLIVSSINRLDEVGGVEFDYTLSPSTETENRTFNRACYLAQDLLKNRVFYLREKGLDDFEKNYRGDLISLYTYGKVLKANNAN